MIIRDLMTAIERQRPLVWNDPQPIEGNDYTINWIEGITSDFDKSSSLSLRMH